MNSRNLITNTFLDSISIQGHEKLDINDTNSFKSDWLINSFHNNTWILKKHNSYFDDENEEWRDVIIIYWGTRLPNQELLTSRKYYRILNTIKKITFLSRQGFEILSGKGNHPTTTRSQQQYDLAKGLILIIQWMINNDHKPEHTEFQTLTIIDFEKYISDITFGSQFCNGTHTTIENFLENEKDKNCLESYLLDGRINYKLISEKLYLNYSNRSFIPSIRLQKYLNKYETRKLPEWLDYSYAKNRRELISTRAESYSFAASQPVTISAIRGYLLGFKAIGRFASILPELSGLDWCDDFIMKHYENIHGFKQKSRTPTIPISTALEYLDHSIAWVEYIGTELVSLKHQYDSELLKLMEGTKSRKDHFANKISPIIPSSLSRKLQDRGLEIKRYNANATNKSYDQVRENLSIEEAVECLVAACFILIGTFTCKRISEILYLTRNSSRPALDGGWELVFGLRKGSPVESLSMIGRPIPDIVNTAIDILCDLAPNNITYQNNNPEKSPLFLNSYKVNRSPIKATQRNRASIYKSLELFADVVQITPDKDNRRWYVRSHELRRFFAISYFWHDQFTGLPALSWFMGHTDPEQTFRYVTEEIAASEIPEEEARYTASIILEHKENTLLGIESIASLAKIYFGTDNLNMIEIHRLESYLTERFNDGYRIIKHGHNARIIYLEENTYE